MQDDVRMLISMVEMSTKKEKEKGHTKKKNSRACPRSGCTVNNDGDDGMVSSFASSSSSSSFNCSSAAVPHSLGRMYSVHKSHLRTIDPSFSMQDDRSRNRCCVSGNTRGNPGRS